MRSLLLGILLLWYGSSNIWFEMGSPTFFMFGGATSVGTSCFPNSTVVLQPARGDEIRLETWINGRSGDYSCDEGDGLVYDESTGYCRNRTVEEEQLAIPVSSPDPLIVPIGRSQALKLTSADEGVLFDLDADGIKERRAWTAVGAELAFVVIDRNGNGSIDDGTEMVGDRLVQGATDGFMALSRIEPINGSPGWIDYDDPIYPKLLLWHDVNHNGISEPAELRPLSDLITRVGLGYSVIGRRDQHGNNVRYQGWATYRTSPGRNDVKGAKDAQERQRNIYDVFLVAQNQ